MIIPIISNHHSGIFWLTDRKRWQADSYFESPGTNRFDFSWFFQTSLQGRHRNHISKTQSQWRTFLFLELSWCPNSDDDLRKVYKKHAKEDAQDFQLRFRPETSLGLLGPCSLGETRGFWTSWIMLNCSASLAYIWPAVTILYFLGCLLMFAMFDTKPLAYHVASHWHVKLLGQLKFVCCLFILSWAWLERTYLFKKQRHFPLEIVAMALRQMVGYQIRKGIETRPTYALHDCWHLYSVDFQYMNVLHKHSN